MHAACMAPRLTRSVMITLLIIGHLNLTACSIFGGSTQPLMVSSYPAGANILINGVQAGTTPLQYQASRRVDLMVEVQKPGYTSQFRSTSRKLSTLGIVDMIGGVMFLLPLLGLIAPGAWEQDPSTLAVTLEPDTQQPAH